MKGWNNTPKKYGKVELRLTKDGETETNYFEQATPAIARYWVGKVDKVEYRINGGEWVEVTN